MNGPEQRLWRGSPRPGELARDALAAARAQLATTVTLAVILATACFAILVTTGQAAASEARVMDHIDSVGTRLIALSDDDGAAGILPDAPAAVARLSDVTWAIGLGQAVDVTNPLLPDARVASRVLVGGLPPEFVIVQGRAPRSGEAVVGVSAAVALHVSSGMGSVQVPDAETDAVAVVGIFEATGPVEHLNATVLVETDPESLESLRYLYVMASDVTVVDRLGRVLTSGAPALDPSALTVEEPSGAIALRQVVAGQLGTASRQLMALVMGVGAVIIAVAMLSATGSRRRDLGRRRALGATRSALVAAMLMQTGIASIPGILLGTAGGLATLQAATASLPSARFVTGVAGLALLLALVAAAPVVAHAAHRDPLRILRVP